MGQFCAMVHYPTWALKGQNFFFARNLVVGSQNCVYFDVK
jgi:hypothetical protein